jgi:hypothetical protein
MFVRYSFYSVSCSCGFPVSVMCDTVGLIVDSIVLCPLVVSFRFYTASIRQEVIDAVAQWTRCTAVDQPFRTRFLGESDFACDEPSTNIDHHSLYEVTITVSLVGLATFLVYGTKREYMSWWYNHILQLVKPMSRPSMKNIELSLSYSQTNCK